MLTQKELILPQWRWGLYRGHYEVLHLTATDNSSDEILETVRKFTPSQEAPGTWVAQRMFASASNGRIARRASSLWMCVTERIFLAEAWDEISSLGSKNLPRACASFALMPAPEL
jgi:hypothetical protein